MPSQMGGKAPVDAAKRQQMPAVLRQQGHGSSAVVSATAVPVDVATAPPMAQPVAQPVTAPGLSFLQQLQGGERAAPPVSRLEAPQEGPRAPHNGQLQNQGRLGLLNPQVAGMIPGQPQVGGPRAEGIVNGQNRGGAQMQHFPPPPPPPFAGLQRPPPLPLAHRSEAIADRAMVAEVVRQNPGPQQLQVRNGEFPVFAPPPPLNMPVQRPNGAQYGQGYDPEMQLQHLGPPRQQPGPHEPPSPPVPAPAPPGRAPRAFPYSIGLDGVQNGILPLLQPPIHPPPPPLPRGGVGEPFPHGLLPDAILEAEQELLEPVSPPVPAPVAPGRAPRDHGLDPGARLLGQLQRGAAADGAGIPAPEGVESGGPSTPNHAPAALPHRASAPGTPAGGGSQTGAAASQAGRSLLLQLQQAAAAPPSGPSGM